MRMPQASKAISWRYRKVDKRLPMTFAEVLMKIRWVIALLGGLWTLARTSFIFCQDFCRSLGRALGCLCIIALFLYSSVADAGEQSWQIGFWDWQMEGSRWQLPANSDKIDVLYLQAGTIFPPRKAGDKISIVSSRPSGVTDAAMVYLVWRVNGSQIPPVESVQELTRAYRLTKQWAVQKGLNIIGLQLDYDCPTKQLAAFAKLLESLRQALPQGDHLSITALLDWFRSDGIEAVMSSVDEFVPQFYDVNENGLNEAFTEISKPIDPLIWAPVFNRFGKPFRIGIASFGRSVALPKSAAGKMAKPSFISSAPLTLMAQARLSQPIVEKSTAQEDVVRFRVEGLRSEGRYLLPEATESVVMVVPTKNSIGSAYKAAKTLGGYCVGVVFFRWPANAENMVLRPTEVFRAIAGQDIFQDKAEIEADDGQCAVVSCSDLILKPGNRFSKTATTYTVRGSEPFEYFLPEKLATVGMTGPAEIQVTVPAFAGMTQIDLGRVVTKEPATYTLMENAQ